MKPLASKKSNSDCAHGGTCSWQMLAAAFSHRIISLCRTTRTRSRQPSRLCGNRPLAYTAYRHSGDARALSCKRAIAQNIDGSFHDKHRVITALHMFHFSGQWRCKSILNFSRECMKSSKARSATCCTLGAMQPPAAFVPTTARVTISCHSAQCVSDSAVRKQFHAEETHRNLATSPSSSLPPSTKT